MLCRVRQKGNNSKNISHIQEYAKNKLMYGHIPTIAQELPSPHMITSQNLDIVSNRRFKEIQLMASILAGYGIPPVTDTSSPKLLQGHTDYENRTTYKENVTFDEAQEGWIV